MLKTKALVDSLERTGKTMERLGDTLSSSMEQMTASLSETNEKLDAMSDSIAKLGDSMATTMGRMADRFDDLVAVLEKVAAEFKNPLDPTILAKSMAGNAGTLVGDLLKRTMHDRKEG